MKTTYASQTKLVCALLATSVLAASFTSSIANASGFEKSTMWGAHEAGLAGAATPWVSGANALYYNPAGLVADKTGNEFSVQVTPLMSNIKGPVNFQNQVHKATDTFGVSGGLLYNHTLNEKWGFGAGVYASGGAKAKHNDVEFASATAGQQKLDVFTDISIIELAGGAGYRVNEKLKLGLAYRIIYGNASFGVVQGLSPLTPLAWANLQVKDADDINFMGLKFGAQYKLMEKTTLGFNYRSEVKYEGEGKFAGKVSSPGGALPAGLYTVDSTDAKLKTVFPMQASLGIQQEFDQWRAVAEYVWTQYSRVKNIHIEGRATVNNGAAAVANNPVVKENWIDQHNARIGAEYMGWQWPVRVGYVFTSRVADKDLASAAITPPSPTHGFHLGTGQSWFGDSFKTDAAFEYIFGGADAGVNPAGTGVNAAGNYSRKGKFEASVMALHLGASYSF